MHRIIEGRPVVFTRHARQRMADRGTREEGVIHAICAGERETAQRGLYLCRLNVEFQREWEGKHYAVQQVAPVVEEEPSSSDRLHILFLRWRDADNVRQRGRCPLHQIARR